MASGFRSDLCVDPVARLALSRRLDRFEGPMVFVFRTLFDPTLEDFLFGIGELPSGVRRRHDQIGIGGEDSRPSSTSVRIACDPGCAGVPLYGSSICSIESQIGLAMLGILTVASEASRR